MPPMSSKVLQFRPATLADSERLVPLINAAFSIETFLEGTRTDSPRLGAMMKKGSILLAEDPSGQLLACVYTELRGNRGYLGQLAVSPRSEERRVGKECRSRRPP